MCGVHLDKRQGAVDYVTLANHWQIPLHKARNTVKQTAQRGMHNDLHPTLLQHFRTNDGMLCYWASKEPVVTMSIHFCYCGWYWCVLELFCLSWEADHFSGRFMWLWDGHRFK